MVSIGTISMTMMVMVGTFAVPLTIFPHSMQMVRNWTSYYSFFLFRLVSLFPHCPCFGSDNPEILTMFEFFAVLVVVVVGDGDGGLQLGERMVLTGRSRRWQSARWKRRMK